MNALHVIFYLLVGAGMQIAVPQIPVIGTTIVSVAWHTYRQDTHDVFEVKAETDTMMAGAVLGRMVR